MTKKAFGILIALVLISSITFSGCATMFRTNNVNVAAASGALTPVKVLENGFTIYEGNLPASFPVKSNRSYSIIYTTPDGGQRTISLSQKFNGWFIGSILLALVPVIVDLVTGSVMTFEKDTVLPISFSPEIIIGENIPLNSNLKVIGNIYDDIESNNENNYELLWSL